MLARVVALEDSRSFGGGWLQEQVHHPDHEVRRQTVLALGRIGRPEAVAPLAAVLGADPAGSVRAAAAFALGIVEDPLPEEAVSALEAALGDASRLVREKTTEALGRRGGSRAAEIVRGRLDRLLSETAGFANWREDVEVSSRRNSYDRIRLALFALARVRDDGQDPGGPGWLVGADGIPASSWWAAAWTASRLRQPELLPAYRFYAGSQDPVVRMLGIRGLGLTLPTTPDEVSGEPELGQQWNNPDEAVRVEAFRAAAAIARADRPLPASTGGAVMRAVREETPAVRREALAALAVIRHPEAVEVLLDLLQAPAPDLRAGALRALHHQDPTGFFLLLSGWSDRDPAGRREAARTLAKVRDPRIRNFLLRNLLPDEDEGVRTAALAALVGLEALLAPADRDLEAVLGALTAHLEASPIGERTAAAKALGELAERIPAGAWSRVLAELRRTAAADRGARPDYRLAALRTRIRRGTDGAPIEAAREALADPAWAVRREAHAFLRRSGEEVSDPDPAPELEADEYDAMLHPPFTPVAWIETDRGEIEVELFIADAPRTVWRFMRMAREGFYEGVRFERVVPNAAVETGEPPDGRSAAAEAVRCEINERFAMRGSLGMVRDGKDTGTHRFFVTLLPQPQLNGRATLFGQVRNGFRVLDRIRPGDRIRRIRVWDGITPPG